MKKWLRHRSAFATFCVALTTFAGCAGGEQRLATAQAPGAPVISYPNTYDKYWTTAVLSQPDLMQAGIDGRVLSLEVFNRQQLFATELSVDLAGNVGIRGTLFSRSSRKEKKDIHPYRDDALQLLDQVRMVSYRYTNESNSVHPHVGFIAEEAPVEFSGPKRTSLDINNSLAIDMAATKQLNSKVHTMQRQIAELQREIRTFARKRKGGNF